MERGEPIDEAAYERVAHRRGRRRRPPPGRRGDRRRRRRRDGQGDLDHVPVRAGERPRAAHGPGRGREHPAPEPRPAGVPGVLRRARRRVRPAGREPAQVWPTPATRARRRTARSRPRASSGSAPGRSSTTRRRSSGTSRASRRARRASTSSTRSSRWSRPRASTGSTTSTTRARRSSSTRSPTRCTRSTRRSSTPGCWSRSTTPSSCTSTTRSSRSAARSRTTGAGPSSASTRSSTRSRGLPEDRIRYHVCFGSWHAPHVFDPPLADLIDLVLKVPARYYLMEQANPRHEHEWRIWEDVKLPEGKVLVPGVVTHHTNVVEHPQLVADRLVRLANLVGRDERDGRHRLRVRPGRVHPPRAPDDPVGEARGARRGRAARDEAAVRRRGGGLRRCRTGSSPPTSGRSSARRRPRPRCSARRRRRSSATPSPTWSSARSEAGIDIVDDGEFGKSIWQWYVTERLDGIERREHQARPLRGRDHMHFPDFYAYAQETPDVLFHGSDRAFWTAIATRPVCIGPIAYKPGPLERDLANLRAALEGVDVVGAFMPAVAPASAEVDMGNEHYATQEELLWALADALREEYRAIIDAGFQLQVDDAWIPALWDHEPDLDLETYRGYCLTRIEALNHALEGLPEERVRYHLCWGSWHGPHSTDIPLAEIVDLMLKVNAGTYSVEAANVRHEHEYHLWESVEAARREEARAGRRHPLDEPDRASGARRRADRPVRGARRARERDREHRLRLRLAHPPGARLGEARRRWPRERGWRRGGSSASGRWRRPAVACSPGSEARQCGRQWPCAPLAHAADRHGEGSRPRIGWSSGRSPRSTPTCPSRSAARPGSSSARGCGATSSGR